MWRFERVMVAGSVPNVTCPDGRVHAMEVCSHLPLEWLLKQPVSAWELEPEIDPVTGNRLTVVAPGLPPEWTA
jgi:hypothetical protein